MFVLYDEMFAISKEFMLLRRTFIRDVAFKHHTTPRMTIDCVPLSRFGTRAKLLR